eukprot:217964-Chlamydomonas_euryale.AAC.3
MNVCMLDSAHKCSRAVGGPVERPLTRARSSGRVSERCERVLHDPRSLCDRQHPTADVSVSAVECGLSSVLGHSWTALKAPVFRSW